MFTLFQNSGAEQMKRVATVDLAHGVMQVNTNWMDSRRFEPLMEYLRNGIDKYIGDKAKVELTGTGALFVEVTNSTIMDLVRSFSVAFLGVTLFMAFLLRSAKIGAIAMLPNLLPIAGVLGLMGYAGIWLDYSNVLIASIALGIVVDDTIHFLHQFRAQHLATGSVEAGLEHAYRHTGRAMVITSVVLVGGFAVFLLASLGNVRLFGFLTDITVAGALFVDLVLTPALLRALIRSKVTGAGAATA